MLNRITKIHLLNGEDNNHYDTFNPPPPVPKPLSLGSWNLQSGKGLFAPSEYLFSFILISTASKNTLAKCFTHKHSIPSLAPARSHGDHQIDNFGRGFLAQQFYASSLYYRCAVVDKTFHNWSFLTVFAPPLRPWGAGFLKATSK